MNASAVVLVTTGTNDFAELFIINRLVRIHGINLSGIGLPGRSHAETGKERVERLQALEEQAKK